MSFDDKKPAVSAGKSFVDTALEDSASPVVLFTLSWCSYCHAAKQLLQKLGVPYREHELDRGDFLEPKLEQEVRGRLQELTRSTTLPQLFIRGEHVGGFTETYAALQNGVLAELLNKHRISSTLS